MTEITFSIHGRTRTRIRRQWDSIQGKANVVDFERAKLLHEAYVVLNKDAATLAAFIVAELDEYPGKRTMSFVRLALAYETIDDRETWAVLGGKAVVLLARIPRKRDRNKVMRRVRKALESTGRDTIALSTFRNCAHEALGEAAYRELLLEPSSNGTGVLRAELIALKRFVLTLLSRDPSLKRGMPAEVKRALGIASQSRAA